MRNTSHGRDGSRGARGCNRFRQAPNRDQSQNDIDTFAALGRGIVRLGLLSQKFDRFPNAGIAKFDSWNDDRVELVRNPRRSRRISCKRVGDGCHGLTRWSDGLFPPFLDLPKLLRTRFVICLLAVVRSGEVDSLFSAARGHVVRIECQDLLVFLESEVMTSVKVVALRLSQEFLHFLDL